MAIDIKPVAAIVAAVAALLSPAGRIYLTDTDPTLASYQAKCHTLHVLHFAALANAGLHFTAGEAHRSEWQAMEYAKKGIGIANSLHTKRLAWDMFAYTPAGVSFKREDYVVAGESWEALGKQYGVPTSWGGRFNDAVHFSCAYQGVK
jgi:hypothetical protein